MPSFVLISNKEWEVFLALMLFWSTNRRLLLPWAMHAE